MGRPEQTHWRDSNCPRGTRRWWGGAGRGMKWRGQETRKRWKWEPGAASTALEKEPLGTVVCLHWHIVHTSQCSFRSGHKLPCPLGLASSLIAGTKEEVLVRALITVMVSVPTLQTFCSFQHDLWTEHGTGVVLTRSRSAGVDVKSESHSLEKVAMLPVCPLDSPTLLYKTSMVTERPPHMQARESFHRMLEVPTKILELSSIPFIRPWYFSLKLKPVAPRSMEKGNRWTVR